MSTVLLRRLYDSVNHLYCDGKLPADVKVEDARLPADRIGDWHPRTHVLRVDCRRSPNWLETLAHEVAHVRTPELKTASTWHGEPFERERLRIYGHLLNGIKRREKSDRSTPPRGRAAAGTKPTPAPGRGPHDPASFDGMVHRPTSSPRRGSMRNPQLEYADGDRPQAREQYEAIRYTIDTLERRTPGSTKSITRWTTRRCRDGKLVGVPAPMRVREARRALEDQRRAWSAS